MAGERSPDLLELVLEASNLGVFREESAFGPGWCSPRCGDLFGVEIANGFRLTDVAESSFHDDDVALAQDAIDTLRRSGQTTTEFTPRVVLSTGETRWLKVTLQSAGPVEAEQGEFSGVVEDITDARNAEELRRNFKREVNHRVKNMITIIQGLSYQTFRRESSARALGQAFEGRLLALSKTHDLLAGQRKGSVGLEDIIRIIIGMVSPEADRVQYSGPDVSFSLQSALTIALVLHELTTNASRHGALSNDTGRVAIEWSVTDSARPEMTLKWRETGGPPVTRPESTGFGTDLLARAIATEFNGAALADYRPDGLMCTIKAELPPHPEAVQ